MAAVRIRSSFNPGPTHIGHKLPNVYISDGEPVKTYSPPPTHDLFRYGGLLAIPTNRATLDPHRLDLQWTCDDDGGLCWIRGRFTGLRREIPSESDQLQKYMT